MSKFKMGEIVVFIDSEAEHKHLIGEECEILSLLDKSYSNYPTNQFYELSLKGFDGCHIGCAEDCLRKKKPPEASWEEIQSITNWHPQKVTA